MKIVATIEARMTSSRLPGKVLLPAAGQPMLLHLVNRLKQVKSIDHIVIATTVNRTDDVIEKFAKDNQVDVYRGSELDVMSRVLEAGSYAAADVVVEITGDCPVIDPSLVQQTISIFLKNDCDYASNSGEELGYPNGMDTQVFRLDTLRRSFAMTEHPLDREHVTRHIRLNPDLFRIINVVAPPELYWPELGLTLDEPRDYQLLRSMIEYFSPHNPYFSCGEAIELLKKIHPEWLEINRDVRRKGISE